MPEAISKGNVSPCGSHAVGFFGVVGAGATVATYIEKAAISGARTLFQSDKLTLVSFVNPEANAAFHRLEGIACFVAGELYGLSGAVDAGPAARVAAAYLGGGPKNWAGLDGLFAVALWDARSSELLLYRDPSGGAVIYHAELGEAFWPLRIGFRTC